MAGLRAHEAVERRVLDPAVQLHLPSLIGTPQPLPGRLCDSGPMGDRRILYAVLAVVLGFAAVLLSIHSSQRIEDDHLGIASAADFASPDVVDDPAAAYAEPCAFCSGPVHETLVLLCAVAAAVTAALGIRGARRWPLLDRGAALPSLFRCPAALPALPWRRPVDLIALAVSRT